MISNNDNGNQLINGQASPRLRSKLGSNGHGANGKRDVSSLAMRVRNPGVWGKFLLKVKY